MIGIGSTSGSSCTWNTNIAMCWMCNATAENFKEQSAESRNRLKSKAKFLDNLKGMKKPASPFWQWAWNPATLCCPDWLHSCDLGIGADISGMLLCEIANKMEGSSFKARVSNLWAEIKDLYREMRVEYRMSAFSPEVFNKGKRPQGPPTLKAPAAQVRQRIPLLPILANKHLDGHELACQRLASFLAKAYACMECNDTNGLPKAGHKVARQYIELEKEASALDPEDLKSWHIMPKLHLFLHLCENGFPPKDT